MHGMNIGSIQTNRLERSTMDSIPYRIVIGVDSPGVGSIVCYGCKCTTIYIKRGI